jgi:hypothetical protein
MSRTGSRGQANGRANKRAKLDEDVEMNGDGEDDGVSKEADDLVSTTLKLG